MLRRPTRAHALCAQASALALALVVGSRSPASAGIADSPLPSLGAGATTYHLFSVPGVISFGDLDTFFACTSTSPATIRVGVELFGQAGGAPLNQANATARDVAPGGSVIFGTGVAEAIQIDANLDSTSFSKGSARIVATSKKLVCTAFVADTGNNAPESAWQLTIIAKTWQRAAN